MDVNQTDAVTMGIFYRTLINWLGDVGPRDNVVVTSMIACLYLTTLMVDL
jgi:hypothetical protein